MTDPPTWERVQVLFLEAVELAPEGREALLEGVAASDPDLVQEVRSLLAAHLGAGPFLAGPAVQDLARTPGPGDRIVDTLGQTVE